ncbi:MAG: Rne/Rng family ribonuclease [Firmicutes bacterium]|nr:Rne/Rng family ribonuclease [Bacillota bacterium]
MTEIIADVHPSQTRVVLLKDGEPVEYNVARKGSEPIVGNIYKGKVENVIVGMQAAFVDIGLERNAFLYAGDILADTLDFEFEGEKSNVGEKIGNVPINKLVHPGQEIIVQVLKEAGGSKGARVTTNITVPGKNLVLMPTVSYVGVSRRISDEAERARLKSLIENMRNPGHGYIVRTAAQNQSQEAFEYEMQYLERKWQQIQTGARQQKSPSILHRESSLILTTLRDVFNDSVDRFIINDRAAYEQVVDMTRLYTPELVQRVEYFDKSSDIYAYYQLSGKLNRLLERRVWLDSGAYLVIDYTEALTVIDVNTGKFTGDTRLADTILQTNILAAKEIARQIRLRGIGGIIIIDFIDMESDSDRQEVLEALRQAVKQDRVKTNIVGFTGLGLVEMTRKKVRPNLSAVLQKQCSHCAGSGLVLNDESVVHALRLEISRIFENSTTDTILLIVHPDIENAIMNGDILYYDKLQWAGRKIFVKGDITCHIEDTRIERLSEEEIYAGYSDVQRFC